MVGTLNDIKDAVASGTLAGGGRVGPQGLVGGVITIGHGTGVGLVDVEVVIVNVPVRVASLLSNELQEVGTAIPATEGGKTPVSRQGGDDAVVGVEGIIGGTLQVLGDGTTNKEGVDTVGDGVVSRLVEGNQDEGILGEVLVLEERGNEALKELTSNGDVGVVSIVGHVRSDEHVLGDALVLKILLKGGEVLDLARTDGIVGDGVEEDQGVVLAHIGVGSGLGVAVTLVAGVGQVLLVLTPGNLLGVEQIGNGGDVGWQLVEVIVVHAKGITGSGGSVVGLRGVSQGKVVGQEDTLLGQLGEVLVIRSCLVVLGTILACEHGRYQINWWLEPLTVFSIQI